MFGEKLQKLRKEKRLSQENLAEQLSVSRQAVSKWESNQVYPEMEKLIDLRNFFDISLDELLIDNTEIRANIIGAGEVGKAQAVDLEPEDIQQINQDFWESKASEGLGEINLPDYGPFLSEEKLQLLENLSNKKVLEIGCGSGQSLDYIGKQGAAELWGIDISEQQLSKAKQLVETQALSAHLLCASMEEDENELPKAYFDLVYSIYAIGWSQNLERTFSQIASYLKTGASFIFSWSHPIHKAVALEKNQLIFKRSYFDESWYQASFEGKELSLSDRKLSTYVNALAKAGFVIEEMIEETDIESIEARKDRSDFAQKARMLPVTFVIKARKL